MKLKQVNILIALIFLIANSNLFFYQHYCGDELYATSFYHTSTCECNDVMHLSHLNWINIQDDGCCQEKLIFAHINNPFVHYALIIQIFFVLLAIFLPFLQTLLNLILFSHSIISKIFLQFVRCYNLFYIHSIVRSVVLRN
ncbi:MAG: hypothetical protein KatS3mg027_0475 [Bacteroidia bacterium]|nr:MAG: hypothetical protein KatS3mg027_0475 [Bacteroidia bacterium]